MISKDRGGVFTFEADNIVSRTGSWPNPGTEKRLSAAAQPTLEIRRKAEMLLYEIGKLFFRFNLFED